ncbi:phosphoribosylaminoimidazole-succinocarboxamide synthase [Kineosphaera limosa]|uniref:Phosphoribosylaminoimidazole-succinocarboxamide synthase n=1 Tax=Kineosphaera limosa NBRC 100340 TaxID=1184609 RepID=K6WP34_9MICO|nr:phosphoribosylaminoimidazolesuccinocarboxamide synthase [Kineosphaera limosa]NYD99882.1 phosphoribosylaminoimidazole-succinocarboxamide synthase [Kineosphaera limosa]GAB95581.1 phosphoribosylaminoimidazole-succinocarboxamide synthase [Kineosphaera limosa NBRC 100340]
MTDERSGATTSDTTTSDTTARAEGDAAGPPLPGYVHVYSGKVRDLYAPVDPVTGETDQTRLLLVASDRVSAYDWVLDSLIPDKGAILTQLSLWWFERLADLVPNHVVSTDVPAQVAGRAVLVRRLQMVPVEAIGRAYLTGSGLVEYRERGSVCGVSLPQGLTEASRLPEPIFTPTTKAPIGSHDEAITYEEVVAQVGAATAAQLRRLTTAILARGNEIAAQRGVLIADTKVEFGIEPDGSLVLADEVLTPDSSRFWPASEWVPGRPQRSYDKQFVRDWLTSAESGWDRHGEQPPPALPSSVVEQTRATYVAAYESITGRRFE